MKATKKNVAAAILEKHGHKVELVKGDGYHYFTTAESDWELAKVEPIAHAEGSMILVMYLSDFDVDRWVSEYEYLIKDVEMPDPDYDYGDVSPITLKMNF